MRAFPALLTLALVGCAAWPPLAGDESAKEPEPAVTVALPAEEAAQLRRRALEDIEETERLMVPLADELEDPDRRLRYGVVRSLLAEARGAVDAGDVSRAAQLASKAHLLAEALGSE